VRAAGQLLAVALMATLAAGCAAVEPWQRGYLARPDMSLAAGPGTGKVLDKTYASKEAAVGGDSVGGGGCGCN
jgi:hypothetical protein